MICKAWAQVAQIAGCTRLIHAKPSFCYYSNFESKCPIKYWLLQRLQTASYEKPLRISMHLTTSALTGHVVRPSLAAHALGTHTLKFAVRRHSGEEQRRITAAAQQIRHASALPYADATQTLELASPAKIAYQEAALRDTLSSTTARYGSQDEDTLAAMSVVVSWLTQNGKFSEAEPLAWSSHQLHVAVHGPAHTKTLSSVLGWAECLQAQGKFDAATACLCRTHTQCLDAGKHEEHPDTIAITLALAECLAQRSGNFYTSAAKQLRWEASVMFQQALAALPCAARGLANSEHLQEAIYLQKQLSSLRWQDPELALPEELLPYTEQLASAHKALGAHEQVLGTLHPISLSMRYSLASDILDQESPEAARATLVEALKQAQQQLGAQHPYTLVAACYLGSWLLRAAHRMAYRGHLYDVTAGNYLMDPPGGVLPKSQAMEAADALRAEADACVVMLVDADLTGKLSMDAARSVLEAADCLARAVADSEQGPDAPAMAATGVDALQKVHALAVQVFGEEHYEALRRMQPIVQQYHVRESSAYDPQAAEDLCKHALESCTAALGATHVTTLRLASELASYGDGQDGEAAARAARAQIAAVLQQQVQVLGGEHADVQHTLWRLLAVQSDSEWSGSPIERLRELWNLPNLYEVPEQLWPVPLF